MRLARDDERTEDVLREVLPESVPGPYVGINDAGLPCQHCLIGGLVLAAGASGRGGRNSYFSLSALMAPCASSDDRRLWDDAISQSLTRSDWNEAVAAILEVLPRNLPTIADVRARLEEMGFEVRRP